MSEIAMTRGSVARWSVPLGAAALVLIALVAPIGFGAYEWSGALENVFHAPLFAAIAVGVLWWWHAKSPELHTRHYVAAFLFAVTLGATTEFAQSFTATRHPEWLDLINDVCGAILGLGFFALFDPRKAILITTRGTIRVLIAVSAVIVVTPLVQVSYVYWQRWQQVPNLVTWESSAGYHFVTSKNAELSVIELGRWGNGHELAMQVTPVGGGRWASLHIDEPWADWSSYSQLAIDVVNPRDKAITLRVRINDRLHNDEYADRFNKAFVVPPVKRTTVVVPLQDVLTAPAKRQMDMQEISRVTLFQDADQGAYVLYVASVRLVP